MCIRDSVPAKELVTEQSQPMRLAARIAANRTVAGVHYPTDSMAGAVLGLTIGEMIVSALEGETETPVRVFDGASFTGDFDLASLHAVINPQTTKRNIAALQSDVVSKLWAFAKAEWKPTGV